MLKNIYNFFKIDFHQNRVFGLDILRAIAIISVVYGHASLILPGDPTSFYIATVNFLDGVFVFFVLSGFLIGGMLIHTIENKAATRSNFILFWKQRLLRILPAYYLVLIVLIVWNLIVTGGFGPSKQYFFFIQNFCTSHPYFFPEAWTLSIEFWFYLLIPLFVFILKGYFKLSDKNSLLVPVIIFILFGFFMRLFRAYTFPELDGYIRDDFFRKQVVTRIDSIAFGVLGAYIHRYYKSVWSDYKYLFLVLGILIFLVTKSAWFNVSTLNSYVLIYTFQALSLLLILPYFNSIKTGKGLFFTIMTGFSYISFSVYLLNLTLIQVNILGNINYGSITGLNLQILKYFLYIVLSILGGIILHKQVEIPFMKMRKKL